MEFVELAGRARELEVRSLLADALGHPEMIGAVAEEYATRRDRFLFGLVEGGETRGVIGGTFHAGTGEILHIAVLPKYRLRGLGRRMVDELTRALGVAELRAETDREAVGFYERIGFSKRSLGQVYPGVERFACSWRAL